MSKEKIRNTWNGMRNRCCNPNSSDYQHYGGRGITICDRWMEYENFYQDMSPTWFEGATIDRIDNDGNYTPENCQWLTRSENVKKENINKLSSGKHHLTSGSIQREANRNRVDNGTHNFLGRDNGIARNLVLDGSHPWLGKGMMTAFDTLSNGFVRIPVGEYKESNDRYYAPNSKFVKQMIIGGV